MNIGNFGRSITAGNTGIVAENEKGCRYRQPFKKDSNKTIGGHTMPYAAPLTDPRF